MTDSISRILENVKEVKKVANNDLSCIVVADDINGVETNYTLNFSCDGIAVIRNNIVVATPNINGYNEDVFLFVLKNLNTLIGNIDEFNKNINLTLNTIPTLVFSSSLLKKEGVDDEEICDDEETHASKEVYVGDKYISNFIAYSNKNILINNTNYFTFLKITAEAGNIEIFDYLMRHHQKYLDYLTEEQMAILIYTAYKRSPALMDKIRGSNFMFGFEVLKLAVVNNDREMLEYLYNEGIDINAVKYCQTILDYAFEKNVNIGMIKFLFDYNIKILNGYYISEYIEKNPKMVELLFKRTDIIDILKLKARYYYDYWAVAHVIAWNEDPEVVKFLLKKENIDDILKMESSLKLSVAYRIADNENPEVIKLLFEREDIDNILKMGCDFIDNSVAHVIARNKNLEVVKLLFEKKDIDGILRMINRIGWSVAHEMANNDNPEVIKLLFEIEDINDILKIKDDEGQSVVNTIAKNENPEVIESLLTCENIELEKEDIDLIKQNFSNNEEIMNLLTLHKLTTANNADEKSRVCNIC